MIVTIEHMTTENFQHLYALDLSISTDVTLEIMFEENEKLCVLKCIICRMIVYTNIRVFIGKKQLTIRAGLSENQ
jgi:hypothetical protein